MLQDVQVHQLDVLASRDCGRVRVNVEILDSIGPAIVNEDTSRIAMIATVRFIFLIRIGTLSFTLRWPCHPRFTSRQSRKTYP
jgi:hypothetical protein